ncbi:hypothetical protein Halha_2297 [Halobacteroides halobius DSM 5150]|uniref:Phosphatidylglycerol lysyltransferase n=1 Tax=Halobacteroides halobius (strain ATCC 35273 / DSM 5150 / MD-1) TaxID=748449 RepID=L0KAY0_HALHC|nr:lysylphosphatidylglycerol synthase transmembrane domain-containing protein [Halobacteroides halobius]AGB42171.1 hypothetical protein Halha_2297 [Halobacteroides halobius DSM 5150]
MNKLKNKILFTLSFSLIILVILILFTVNQQTWQVLKNLNWIYIVISSGIMGFVWFANGFKLKVLAKGVDVKLPLLAAIEIGLVGSFFANITPSGVGGQPFKVVALAKSNVSSGRASAIVIVELILRLVFFIFSLPLVFFKLRSLFVSYINGKLLILGVTIFILGLLVVIYLLLYHPRNLVLICFWLLNRSLIKKIVDEQKIYAWKRELAREIRIFYQALWRYLKVSKWELVFSFILTVLSWSAQFIVIYFIIRSLNLQMNLGSLILIQLLIYTAAIFIPIPGGSGVEVILASLLQQSLPVSVLGIVVGGWRFFTYYSYLIVGGIISFKVFNLDKEVSQ